MSTPTIDPSRRSLTHTPPGGYRPGQRVWVHRSGDWRPGIVVQASPQAVTVRYRPAEGRGTGVDTVTCHNLAARDDADPNLDFTGLPTASDRIPVRSTME